MPRPMKKHKYYVKCGQLEKWVIAYDEINAAVVTLMNAPGETMLDPYYFFVSKNYYADIDERYFQDNPIREEVMNDVHIIQTDDVLEMCNMITEEAADEFYLKDMNNEDDENGWPDDRSNEEF